MTLLKPGGFVFGLCVCALERRGEESMKSGEERGGKKGRDGEREKREKRT